MEPPNKSPSFPNVVMGVILGFPFFGSFRGSGNIMWGGSWGSVFRAQCRVQGLEFRIKGLRVKGGVS